MANKCFWNPDTLEVAYEVRPSDSYSQEGTVEEYQALLASRPTPPAPDWLGFKADYKASPTIRAWFRELDPMDREDLAAMVAAQNVEGVAAAMADVDYSAVKDELNGLLAQHHIGLELP